MGYLWVGYNTRQTLGQGNDAGSYRTILKQFLNDSPSATDKNLKLLAVPRILLRCVQSLFQRVVDNVHKRVFASWCLIGRMICPHIHPEATEIQKTDKNEQFANLCRRNFSTLRYHEHVTCVFQSSVCKHSVNTFCLDKQLSKIVWTIWSRIIAHKPCHQECIPNMKKYPKGWCQQHDKNSPFWRTCDHKNAWQKKGSCTWCEQVPTCDYKKIPEAFSNVCFIRFFM